MPTFLSAKKVAENALKTIGAFPPSMSSADPGELKTAMQWLEMILNTTAGIRPVAGFWRIFDIPLEAGVGDYDLDDYADDAGVQHVFSVNIVDAQGDVDPLEMIFENDSATENLEDTGQPDRVVITRDAHPVLKVYPTPTSTEEDAGLVLRVRVQTYHTPIDHAGIGDEDLLLRPSWYLWVNNKLAYELGKGPVRRLQENELKRFQTDYMVLESALLARDGQYNSGKPPVTEPMAGS